jgi:hypothetical protein
LLSAIAILLCPPPSLLAEDIALSTRRSETEEAMRERNLPQPRDFLELWQVQSLAPRRTTPRVRLDAEPLLTNLLDVLNDLGIPLRQYRDPRGLRALGVSASFSIGAEYPAVNFHLADRCPEQLTAFYRGGRGLSWAFIWPSDLFTLRLEGGDDSEFGSYAIAGAQWNHPRLPLAVGIGLPVRMKHADGLIGAIIQVRAKLN